MRNEESTLNRVQYLRRNAETRERAADRCVRRSHVRVRAEVDVQQTSVRTLHENAPARTQLRVQIAHRVAHLHSKFTLIII